MNVAPVRNIDFGKDHGRRVLRVTVDVDERVAAVVRLKRCGRRLARDRCVGLGPGRHDLELPLNRLVPRGPAKLIVAFGDMRGETTTFHRSLDIP